MKTCIRLRNEQPEGLPEPFAHDDVRYPSELVRIFLAEYTRPGDLVFDPFAGFGTCAGYLGQQSPDLHNEGKNLHGGR